MCRAIGGQTRESSARNGLGLAARTRPAGTGGRGRPQADQSLLDVPAFEAHRSRITITTACQPVRATNSRSTSLSAAVQMSTRAVRRWQAKATRQRCSRSYSPGRPHYASCSARIPLLRLRLRGLLPVCRGLGPPGEQRRDGTVRGTTAFRDEGLVSAQPGVLLNESDDSTLRLYSDLRHLRGPFQSWPHRGGSRQNRLSRCGLSLSGPSVGSAAGPGTRRRAEPPQHTHAGTPCPGRGSRTTSPSLKRA